MRTVLLIITALFTIQLSAQPRVGFAYYDVDRAYDTLPSLFYDDSDYTPEGRKRWTTERYTRKIDGIAAVIDSMALPIVALYGVENEQVVRDISSRCKGDYSYIHRTLNRLDGMDFALLYYGDVLFPESVEVGLDYMLIRAAVGKREFALLLARRPRGLKELVAQLYEQSPKSHIIIAGDLYGTDYSGLALNEATAAAERSGHGNTIYRGAWKMFDRILVDKRLETHCDVYARRWLMNDNGEPKPTFNREGYVGGTSRKLPIFCYWR